MRFPLSSDLERNEATMVTSHAVTPGCISPMSSGRSLRFWKPLRASRRGLQATTTLRSIVHSHKFYLSLAALTELHRRNAFSAKVLTVLSGANRCRCCGRTITRALDLLDIILVRPCCKCFWRVGRCSFFRDRLEHLFRLLPASQLFAASHGHVNCVGLRKWVLLHWRVGTFTRRWNTFVWIAKTCAVCRSRASVSFDVFNVTWLFLAWLVCFTCGASSFEIPKMDKNAEYWKNLHFTQDV